MLYSHSYLSEQYPDKDLSARGLSSFLRLLGEERGKIVEFCRSFDLQDDCIIFDGTDILSCSEKMWLPKLSKSKSANAWRVNLIALKWYYHILNLLKEHELNKNHTPNDLLMMLAEIKKVKINDIWLDAEKTKKTSDLMLKLKRVLTKDI